MNDEERYQLINKCIDACKGNDRGAVKACLEADPSIIDESMPHRQYSVLGAAAWDGSEDLAIWLLDQGANPRCRDALSAACIGNKTNLLNRMVAEAEFEPKVLTGYLPPASRRHAHDAMRILLEHGADPNHRLEFGECDGMGFRGIWHRSETALHLAASRGDVTAVQILREGGADPSIEDAHYESPLAWFSRFYLGAAPERSCRGGTREEMAELLTTGERSKSIDQVLDYESPPLCLAAESGDTERVRSLLANGEDPNRACPATGETPLHQAATFNQTEIAQLLLSAGANPNAKAAFGVPTRTFWRDVSVVGETPLHRAAGFACEALMVALKAAGADMGQLDANGEAGLTWFSRTLGDRYVDIAERTKIQEIVNPDAWPTIPRGRWG